MVTPRSIRSFEAMPVLLQLVPAAYGDEAELRAREVQDGKKHMA